MILLLFVQSCRMLSLPSVMLFLPICLRNFCFFVFSVFLSVCLSICLCCLISVLVRTRLHRVHRVPKNVHLFIFQITLSKINQFQGIFVCYILRKFDINCLYVCPPHPYTVATLPWKIKKKSFSTVPVFFIRRLLQIICVVTEENKLLLPTTTP